MGYNFKYVIFILYRFILGGTAVPLSEKEQKSVEGLRNLLRLRIIDVMLLKNHLIRMLETLTDILEQGKKDSAG